MKTATTLAALATSLALAACVNISTTDSKAPLSAVRSSAMGPGQYMVSCVDSPTYCANEANKLCPRGFDVASNVTNAADYGRMTMTIKCHAATP
jgi:hypothetical protein